MACKSVLLFLAVVLAAQQVGVKQEKYSHPGTIVDAATGKGIQAGAYAYGSQEQVGDGDCPRFRESLDSEQSEQGTGSFTYQIDKSKASYVAVYCQNGYASRTEDKNDNSQDGTRVQPDPISLLPKQAKLASLGINPVDASYLAVARTLDRAQSDLRYLARADEGAFYKALARFPEEDRNIVKMLYGRKPTGVLVKPLQAFITPRAAM
ncbi:MAG TPA: hypothetical protein VNL38_00200 [Candidatus Nitrosotenuis sp.]|nr:hypothetical protein [Candidatus Nitrosotenuis sp.]